MTIPRLLHAGVCAAFGYSAFFAFIILKNYPSAVLGLISGITDSILFFLHYLCRKGELRQWYDQPALRIICRYGIVVGTVGLLCLGYFTTIQVMYNKPILPIPDSCVIAIVWSIVAMRSGIILMGYCIYYQRNDDRANDPRLISEPVQNPAEEVIEEIGPEPETTISHDQP